MLKHNNNTHTKEKRKKKRGKKAHTHLCKVSGRANKPNDKNKSLMRERGGGVSVNMVLNVHRNLKAYGGGGGMEVGEEGDYIPIATLSPPEMTPALRWAAMRAVLMFH